MSDVVKPASPSTGEPSSGYAVQVGSFEGPLDLLLHLVRINEVDITDIPIVEITRQYQEYLALMEALDLEIAGEYLVMAATLMHIKSRMLLPPDPTVEDEETVDPRQELTQQLLDYQRFRQAAENLQAMESRMGLIWAREDVPPEFADEELLAVDMFDLLRAFQQLLGRLGEEARLRLKKDTVSVAEKIAWLGDLLERESSVNFGELLAALPSRLERIATFLAVLEMMRLSLVIVFQRKLLGEIRLARRAESAGPAADRPLQEEGEA